MKARLIKRENGYILIDTNKSNEDRWCVIGSYPYNKDVEELSLKNCQAVEIGYSLDEIASSNGYNKDLNGLQGYRKYTAFEQGFQNGIQTIGNNKFNEEDIRKAIAFGWDYEGMTRKEMEEKYNLELEYNNSYNEDVDKFIKSLKKTEWDVKIEFEINHEISNGSTECFTDFKPKLDSEGCLILRRI